MTQKVYGMTDVIHEIKRIADALELVIQMVKKDQEETNCLLYTSPSPRDKRQSRMPSSA